MPTTLSMTTSNSSDVLTVSAKGWVVIPAPMRKKYGLTPGATLTIVDYGGVLALVPLLAEPIQQARGLLAGPTSLTQALLAERKAERRREQ
jgi:AbrB family looped-hinge helix DNA binding protein